VKKNVYKTFLLQCNGPIWRLLLSLYDRIGLRCVL